MATLDTVLTEAVASGASDVYFLEGVPPAIKVDGLVSPIAGAEALDTAAMTAVIERLLPVRERAADLQANPGKVRAILAEGGSRARAIAGPAMAEVRAAMGLRGEIPATSQAPVG